MIIFNNKIIISDFSLINCFSIIFDKIELINDFKKRLFKYKRYQKKYFNALILNLISEV